MEDGHEMCGSWIHASFRRRADGRNHPEPAKEWPHTELTSQRSFLVPFLCSRGSAKEWDSHRVNRVNRVCSCRFLGLRRRSCLWCFGAGSRWNAAGGHPRFCSDGTIRSRSSTWRISFEAARTRGTRKNTAPVQLFAGRAHEFHPSPLAGHPLAGERGSQETRRTCWTNRIHGTAAQGTYGSTYGVVRQGV
jgi:hypothetical protein